MNPLLTHFGLRRAPFARTTPKEAVLDHPGWTEARKRLRFAVDLDGIATLTSDPGMGKSLLLGLLADELQQDGWSVQYVAHATTGPFGLVNVLARKAGVAPRRSRAETAQLLLSTLLDDQRRHLLVVDEAHMLPDDTLEDIRLLTIADFDRRPPFVLLLAGQVAFEERLADPVHYALEQRITIHARLAPLSTDEVEGYLQRRFKAAGAAGPLLEDGAVHALAERSAGVPRRLNNLATASLIVAAARGRRLVSGQDVQDAHFDRGRP